MYVFLAILLTLAKPVREARVDAPDGRRPQVSRPSQPNPNYPQRAAALGCDKDSLRRLPLKR